MNPLTLLRRSPHVVALLIAAATIAPGTSPATNTKPAPAIAYAAPTEPVAHRYATTAARLQARAQARIKYLEDRLAHARWAYKRAVRKAHAWERWGKRWHRVVQRIIGGSYSVHPRPGARGQTIVNLARSKLGCHYVFGTAGPYVFDCSGLVKWAYAKVGVYLPHAATYQQRLSRWIPRSQLRPGDLVFYGSQRRSYHVAIYIGGGRTIEAAGAYVRYGWVGYAWAAGTFFH